MPKVTFVAEKKEIEVPAGSNLRDEARKAGVQVNFQVVDLASGFFGRYLNCQGHGLCGSCKVLVKKGMENLSPKGRLERFTLGKMMASIGHEEEMRIRRSSLDWTLVRPGVLTGGAATGRYRVLDAPSSWRDGLIARADVALFIVRQAAAADQIRMAVVLINHAFPF